MPTREVKTTDRDEVEHRRRIALAINALLHGAHNEVYTHTFLSGTDTSRFPSGGVFLGTIITGFANLGGGVCRATTSTAHGLAIGDIAIISASTGFNGVNNIITAVNTVAFDFDFAWTWPGASSTGLLEQGFTNARITPSTVPIMIPTTAAAQTLMHTSPYPLHSSDVEYIEFTYSLSAGNKDFIIILFGD